MRRSAAPSIGGLIFATVATLMFVPVVFSILHGRRGKVPDAGDWRTACRLKPPRPLYRAAGLRCWRLLLATVAAIVVVMGITTRKMADAKLSEWTETQAVPVVAVATPDTRGQENDARASGPAGGLYPGADLCPRQRLSEGVEGRHRHPGQGRRTARRNRRAGPRSADHAGRSRSRQRQANAKLSDATLQRGQQLIPSGAVSKQDLDQRAADAANKQGLVKSAQANLDRLRVLEQYKRITAPFDGLVTARTTDVGALINAGRAADRRCSWFPTPAGCASMSTCRKTMFRASVSAPKRR